MTIFNKEIQGGWGKFDEIPHPHPKPLRGEANYPQGQARPHKKNHFISKIFIQCTQGKKNIHYYILWRKKLDIKNVSIFYIITLKYY